MYLVELRTLLGTAGQGIVFSPTPTSLLADALSIALSIFSPRAGTDEEADEERNRWSRAKVLESTDCVCGTLYVKDLCFFFSVTKLGRLLRGLPPGRALPLRFLFPRVLPILEAYRHLEHQCQLHGAAPFFYERVFGVNRSLPEAPPLDCVSPSLAQAQHLTQAGSQVMSGCSLNELHAPRRAHSGAAGQRSSSGKFLKRSPGSGESRERRRTPARL